MNEPIYKAGTRVKLIKEMPPRVKDPRLMRCMGIPAGTEGTLIFDLYDLGNEADVHFPGYGKRNIKLQEYVEVIGKIPSLSIQTR